MLWMNQYRIREGKLASTDEYGLTGAFRVPPILNRRGLTIISSDASDWSADEIGENKWEHVSVSITESPNQIPGWLEMQWVKEQFWGDDEVVLQIHPRKDDYVNQWNALHLWRPIGFNPLVPPQVCV